MAREDTVCENEQNFMWFLILKNRIQGKLPEILFILCAKLNWENVELQLSNT